MATTALWTLAWTSMLSCAAQTARPSTPIWQLGARQLVTVVSDDWSDYQAWVQRYERSAGGGWRAYGAPLRAVIGRAGLGWGRGLHAAGAPPGRGGPIKHEGDGRSPAGVFAIGTAYGYADARPDLALAYVEADPSLRCVDDPQSAHYNRIVSHSVASRDWDSAEHMRRADPLYELAIVVGHNYERVPGAGSCIFLHVWQSPQTPVTGCTALASSDLEDLARWLRAGALLAALPASEYRALQSRWQLPERRQPR